MDKARNHRRLGIMVVISITIASLCLFLLGGRSLFQETYDFETYFDESVAGLDIGAPVRFRGVPMGQVTSINLSSMEYERGVPLNRRRNYIIVRARLMLERYRVEQLIAEADEFIKLGLRTQTELAGITGQQYLTLDLMEPDKYPALPFEWKPRYLYIPSAPSMTREIVNNVQAFLAHLDRSNVQAIANNFNALLSKLNHEMDGVSLSDLSREAVTTIRQARETLAALDKLLSRPEVSAIVGDLARASGRLDGLLSDPGLKNAVDNLAASSERLRRLATSGELDRTLAAIDDLAQRLNGTTRDNSYDVRKIVQDLRATAENLRTLSEALKRDPAGLILGRPAERIQLPFGKAP